MKAKILALVLSDHSRSKRWRVVDVLELYAFMHCSVSDKDKAIIAKALKSVEAKAINQKRVKL